VPHEGAEGEPGAQRRSQGGSYSTQEETYLWIVSNYRVMRKYEDFE